MNAPMKERPILFSAPMVNAIREGRKTQTRRVVKLQPRSRADIGHLGAGVPFIRNPEITRPNLLCPYGQPGDRLRVKEAAWMWCERVPNGTTKTGRKKWHYVPMREAPIHYAADRQTKPAINVVSPNTGNQWGWRLKIGRFLPRWASRIELELTGVRVEQLCSIKMDDVFAEGCMLSTSKQEPRDFMNLWESINGAGSWAVNPWVWVIEFKRVNA